MSARIVQVASPDGSRIPVECFGEFDHEIGGQTFRFLITADVNYGGCIKCVTHKASGFKVCVVGVTAAYLPAYSHLGDDKSRAKASLDALCDKHGAAKVRSKLAEKEDSPPPANPTAPDTRDASGAVVNPQWERFERTLTAQYRYLFQAFPSEYMPVMQNGATPESLAKKMTLGLADGSADKAGKGIQLTCKALGIKHTYKAIRAYLTPAGSQS